MNLQYSSKTKDIIDIEERLKNMSLVYKVAVNQKETEPALIDGSKEYLGYDKMNIYLDQLDREKEQWYYCNC